MHLVDDLLTMKDQLMSDDLFLNLLSKIWLSSDETQVVDDLLFLLLGDGFPEDSLMLSLLDASLLSGILDHSGNVSILHQSSDQSDSLLDGQNHSSGLGRLSSGVKSLVVVQSLDELWQVAFAVLEVSVISDLSSVN